MQPFPRVEFGEEHRQMSLKDLSLVPNGSLVVKLRSTAVPSGQLLLFICLAAITALLSPYNIISKCVVKIIKHNKSVSACGSDSSSK